MGKTATQPKRRLRSAETLHVRQIVQGEATCVYCSAPGAWVIATGSHPELKPYCHEHAATMLRAGAEVIEEWAARARA